MRRFPSRPRLAAVWGAGVTKSSPGPAPGDEGGCFLRFEGGGDLECDGLHGQVGAHGGATRTGLLRIGWDATEQPNRECRV